HDPGDPPSGVEAVEPANPEDRRQPQQVGPAHGPLGTLLEGVRRHGDPPRRTIGARCPAYAPSRSLLRVGGASTPPPKPRSPAAGGRRALVRASGAEARRIARSGRRPRPRSGPSRGTREGPRGGSGGARPRRPQDSDGRRPGRPEPPPPG